MKRYMILILTLCALLSAASVSADPVRENPSIYSYAEIVQKLPGMWNANPFEVLEMMKQYPDYTCERYTNFIECASVNNRYSAEIYLEFQFSSEDDYAEFGTAEFYVPVSDAVDVQKYIELFWLPDMKAAKVWGAYCPAYQMKFWFSTEDTLASFNVLMDEAELPYQLVVNMCRIVG